MEDLKQWLGVAALLISVGGFLYAWLTSGSKKTAGDLVDAKKKFGDDLSAAQKKAEDDHAAIERCTEDHEKRIQALESELRHLPDKDMVHRLELTMKDMQTQMAGMAASAEATARTARRVEEFLIEQARAAA